MPQPVLKWYKDGVELKPGDIHRIISGQDGTCCLGTYTCEANNCMGTVSSSASLLGFDGSFLIIIIHNKVIKIYLKQKKSRRTKRMTKIRAKMCSNSPRQEHLLRADTRLQGTRRSQLSKRRERRK